MMMTANKLMTVQTTIKPRGRRTAPIPVVLVGRETAPGVVDTSVLRGTPLEVLVMYAAEEGLDPSEALGVGINALKTGRVRGTPTGFASEVASRLGITDATKARLTTMHIQKMARQSGRNPQDVLSALELTAPHV